MKTLIMFLALIALLTSICFAAGDNYGVIQREWKRVEAQQKRQDEHFKAIERDAARAIQELNAETRHGKQKGTVPGGR